MTRGWIVAVLLAAGCGASRTPLPSPASAQSSVPALPTPSTPRAPAPRPELPAVRSFALPSGITVEIAERHGAPVVYVALVARAAHQMGDDAPAALDALVERSLGAGLPGDLGDLSGDDDLTATRVSERGLVTVSRTVAGELPHILRRVGTILEGRVLEDGEVTRARAELLDQARFQQAQRRRRRFPAPGDELFTRLYGEDDPRIERARISPRSLERLDVARVRRRLAQLIRPADTALIIVGDLDPDRAEALAREHLSSIEVPEAPPASHPRPPPAFPEPQPRLQIHPTGDEPIAAVRLVEHGPPLEHDDHAAFRLYARLAGGMFSSRLNLELREQRGDTYGVMSHVVDRVDHSLLEISVVVPVQAAGDAAGTIVRELSRLCDPSSIDADELDLARTVELASLAADLDTASGLGSALARAHLAGSPPESILDLHDRVRRLTAADVASASCRWVRPDHAPMTIIGDYRWLISHPVRVPGGVSFINH